MTIARGQRVRFNQHARRWTRGRVFYVSELRPWGLICWTEFHASRAPYRAHWSQIEGIA